MTLSFTQISPTINFSSPGRGAEQWHGGWDVDLSPFQKLDKYARFQWHEFESGKDQYTWDTFDKSINEAIDRGGKFGFGVMTVCDCDANSLASYAGGTASFPQYLHNLMQAESTKDRLVNGQWIPNWNSEAYLSRLEALHKAINNHLETTSYKGVRYKDAISYIDIRGFGQWGEWHLVGIEGGQAATSKSLTRIIDAHINGYPDIRLVAMIAGLNGGSVPFSVFPVTSDVSYYLLTAKNNAGEIGWRRDSLGSTESYYVDLLENNKALFNNIPLKTLIMNKWQKAPVVGEPNCGVQMTELPKQVALYHMMSFGNSNYCVTLSSASTTAIKAAALASGYRLTLTGGTAELQSNGLAISLNWQNSGLTPTYEKWDVIYELRSGSTVIWSGKSIFSPRMFLPGTQTVTEFFLASVPAGTYNLSLKIVDPAGYRKPLPLAINGQQGDGSYVLGNLTSTGSVTTTTTEKPATTTTTTTNSPSTTTTTTKTPLVVKTAVSITVNYSDNTFKTIQL